MAAVDSKAEAMQVNPNDYVPNAAQTDKTIQRVYGFFNTNDKIVHSNYNIIDDNGNLFFKKNDLNKFYEFVFNKINNGR